MADPGVDGQRITLLAALDPQDALLGTIVAGAGCGDEGFEIPRRIERDQLADRPADEGFRRPAEHLGQRLIGPEQSSLRVADRHSLGH